MSILSKAIDEIEIDDLEALISRDAQETSELEFKGKLPFKPEKGKPETEDRWIEKGDRVGEYARDQILAELIAFANADGGTLILGLHETRENPRRAERLEPLPNCEELARRLVDTGEDAVEPRLPILSRPLPADEKGAGYVVLRVARSLNGPHRLRSDGQFYIRRGERASKMTVREIRDLTLELARSGDRLEALFAERQKAAESHYKALHSRIFPGFHSRGLLVRVSALPLTRLAIPGVTNRRDLWWRGGEFEYHVGEQKQQSVYPAREFNSEPSIRLRQLYQGASEGSEYLERVVRDDGLVEFTFTNIDQPREGRTTVPPVFIDWLVAPVVGVLAQVEHLRRSLASDATEYGMEIELRSTHEIGVSWGARSHSSTPRTLSNVILPRYSIGRREEFDGLLSNIVADLWNSVGAPYNTPCTCDWDTVLAPVR